MGIKPGPRFSPAEIQPCAPRHAGRWRSRRTRRSVRPQFKTGSPLPRRQRSCRNLQLSCRRKTVRARGLRVCNVLLDYCRRLAILIRLEPPHKSIFTSIGCCAELKSLVRSVVTHQSPAPHAGGETARRTKSLRRPVIIRLLIAERGAIPGIAVRRQNRRLIT